MKQTLTTQQIADALHAVYDGSSFSRSGAYALAEYLEEYEQDTGEELELDPIAFACDFSEYASLEDAVKKHTTEDDWHNFQTVDGFDDGLIRDWFQENTTLIEYDDGIIIRCF